MQDVMNVNQKEYNIVKLLGHGKGGYSYLAERDGHFYVVKQIHHEPCEYYTFGNKIESERNDYYRKLQYQVEHFICLNQSGTSKMRPG